MQILHKYELISLSSSCRESPGPFFGHLVVFFSVRDILRCNAANKWVRLNQYIKDYRISLILLEFRSVTFYDLLEDRLIKLMTLTFTLPHSCINKYLRFNIHLCLFCNRSQKMPQCGQNISDTLA